MANRIIRTERGWGGHYCSAHKCAFRRNTRLYRGAVSIIISTVGNRNDGQPIGVDGRRYETMVFHSDPEDELYHDIAPDMEIHINTDWQICADSHNDLPDGVDNQANEMHERIVAEITERIQAGEFDAKDS